MLNLLRARPPRLISNRKMAVLGALVLGLGFQTSASMVVTLKLYTALEWEEVQQQSNDAQINLEMIYGLNLSSSDCMALPANITTEGFPRPQMGFKQFVVASPKLTMQMGLLIMVVLIIVMVRTEFSTGAIGTQLTFTPCKLPPLQAKALASAVCGICLMAIWAAVMMFLGVFLYLNVRGVKGLTASSPLGAQAGRALLAGVVVRILAALVTMVLALTAKMWALIFAVLVLSQFLEFSKDVVQAAQSLSTINVFSLINSDWSRTIYNGEGVRQETIPHIDYGYPLGYAVFWLVVFGVQALVSFLHHGIPKQPARFFFEVG